MDNNDSDFKIIVNSPGNFIAKEIHISGDVNISSDSKSAKQNGYTDEQIAKLKQLKGDDIEAINERYITAKEIIDGLIDEGYKSLKGDN